MHFDKPMKWAQTSAIQRYTTHLLTLTLSPSDVLQNQYLGINPVCNQWPSSDVTTLLVVGSVMDVPRYVVPVFCRARGSML